MSVVKTYHDQLERWFRRRWKVEVSWFSWGIKHLQPFRIISYQNCNIHIIWLNLNLMIAIVTRSMFSLLTQNVSFSRLVWIISDKGNASSIEYLHNSGLFWFPTKRWKQLNLFCRNHFRNLMNKKLVVQLAPPVFGQVNLGQWSSSSFSSRRSWAAFFERLCTPQVQVISAEGKGLKHHHHHLQQLQQYHHHHILLILLTMITFITTDNFVVASHLKQFEHSIICGRCKCCLWCRISIFSPFLFPGSQALCRAAATFWPWDIAHFSLPHPLPTTHPPNTHHPFSASHHRIFLELFFSHPQLLSTLPIPLLLPSRLNKIGKFQTYFTIVNARSPLSAPRLWIKLCGIHFRRKFFQTRACKTSNKMEICNFFQIC